MKSVKIIPSTATAIAPRTWATATATDTAVDTDTTSVDTTPGGVAAAAVDTGNYA